MSGGPYRVEHDQSSNPQTYHDLLQHQIDHTGETIPGAKSKNGHPKPRKICSLIFCAFFS